MDADRFDALSRALAAVPARRTLLRLLAGSALAGAVGWLRSEESAAHNPVPACRRIKNRRRRAACLRRARRHNAGHAKPPSCTRDCAGKHCGPDGCGGSCGSCTGGATCTNGTCACPPGKEPCQGFCLPACGIDRIRKPDNCSCCVGNGQLCQVEAPCCSGICSNASGINECQGRPNGASCTFDAQCASQECRIFFPETEGTCEQSQIGP